MEQLEKAIARARHNASIHRRHKLESLEKKPVMAMAQPAEPVAKPITRVVRARLSHLKKMRVVGAEEGRIEADIYRVLRTRLMQNLAHQGLRSVAICSPVRGDGKTLTSVNLAVSLSRELSHTVLLVDADLRHPSVHQYFGIKPKQGLADYLLSKTDLASCLINPGIERLVLLPGRGRVGSSSELLKSDRMTSLASELRDRYADRIIVYDLPPMLASDDAIGILPEVESTLLVVRDGKTHRADIEKSLDLLKEKYFLGVVLNETSENVTQYGYY
jgi:capsular exopolysaccharide synthesis family protein